MKTLTTLLLLMGNAAYADGVLASGSSSRCVENQIFVETSLEDVPCATTFPTEGQKQILISNANEAAANRCSGELEVVEDYQFSSRSNCWSGGLTIHTVRVTFECRSK